MSKNIGSVAIIMLVVVALVVGGCSSGAVDNDATILPDSVELQDGDLVYRCGDSFDSRAVLIADYQGNYSHVGIVVDSCGEKMVVHAVPDEPDFDGDVDRVKMETPQKFFVRRNAKYGEIARFTGDSAIAKRASQIAYATYRRGTLFDNDFNLEDTTEMYCTELIIYAYDRAGSPLGVKPAHKAHWMDYQSVMPSDIVATGKFKTVKFFN